MAVKLREWIQREWTRPNTHLYREKGDFDTLNKLYCSPSRRKLIRAPTWSSHIPFPSGFSTCRGAYYDEANGRICYVGQDSAADLVWCYTNTSWSMSAIQSPKLSAASTNLGGYFGRNLVWRGSGTLYLIDNSLDVYAGAPGSGLTQIYSGSDARIITQVGDRVFLITTTGTIKRLNDAANGFDTFFTPADDLEIVYATQINRNLALVAQDGHGDTSIYYVYPKNPQTLQPVAGIHTAGKHTTHAAVHSQSSLFTAHNDQLFFTSYDHKHPSANTLDLFDFNGSQIAHLGHDPDTAAKPRSCVSRLLIWNDELLVFEASTGPSQTHSAKILTGNGLTTLTSVTAQAGVDPLMWSLGDNLIIVGDPEATEGIYHCTRTALADGSLQTSYLDMGSPGRQKRLDSITALLDGHASNFKTVIKYRTDDSAGWTTAATANNTGRAHAPDLGVSFYTLQIRVELDDDTGANKDFAIEALSAIYSIDD